MRSLLFLFTVAALAADPSEAACSSPFTEVGDRCLRFFPDAELRWTAAQSSCEIIGGHLAEVDTCEVLGEISTFIAASGNVPTTGAYWIGATDLLSGGEYVWVNNFNLKVPLGVPFWGSDSDGVQEPNGGSYQNCVAIPAYDGYHFHDEECDNLYGVLCEQDNAQQTISETSIADFHGLKVTCPVGYTDVDGKCYLALSNEEVTWAQASVTCNFNGGRLANVDQCDQLTGLSQFLQGTSPNFGYWIGFTDENFEGVYQYVDGTVVDLPAVFWGQSDGVLEPSGGTVQNCVALYFSDAYYFHDLECSDPLAVLCEADATSYVN